MFNPRSVIIIFMSALLQFCRLHLTTSAPLACAAKARFLSQMAASDFYSLTPNDINGKPFPFEQLKGKVVLVVNVASK